MNPDQAALDALHAAAVAMARARVAGDPVAEAAARAEFRRIATLYGGFTRAQLDAALAQASADADPFGLKTVGRGMLGLAVVLGVVWFVGRSRGGAHTW